MPPAIPVIAAVAGAAVTAEAGTIIGATLFGSTLLASAAAGLAGFVVSSAINTIGSGLVSNKPSSPDFGQTATGRTLMIRSSIDSHKILYGQVKVSGPMVFAKTVDTGANSQGASVTGTNKFLHLVLALAGHEVDSIPTVYFDDNALSIDPSTGFVTSAPYSTGGLSYARVYRYLGSVDQLADADLIASCGFTSAHRLRGIAYVYVRLEYNADVFPLGIPNISAVVNGKKVFDPRTSVTAWSDNWALCCRDFMTSDYGFGCPSDEMNDTYFIAAANTSDESVATTGLGTQLRYICNGVVDTANAPLSNLGDLLSGGGGAVTYVQGKFRIHAGVYDDPVGDLTDDMLAGPVKITARVTRQSLFNAVKGTFVDPTQQWQPVDFPFLTNPTYLAEDGGTTIFKDITLPFTTDAIAAQRLAKMALDRSRQGIVVEQPVNHSALQFCVYDVIRLTNTQMGWNQKPFRIMKWMTSAGQPISVTLQEESSDSYDWNDGIAIVNDAAPDTNLPSPTTVGIPGTPTVTESLYVTRQNAVKSEAIVDWVASLDIFVTAYELQYKLSSASVWITLPRTSDTTFIVDDIAPGIYDFRTKAINLLGVSSDWATTPGVQIYGLTAVPDDITGFGLTMFSSLAYLSWNPLALPDNLDVAIGGNIEIRHTEDLSSSAAWNSSNLVAGNLSGYAANATVPLKPGTYLVKARDSSGNYSANAALISTLAGTLATFTNGSLIEEDPGFTTAFPNSPYGGSSIGVVFDPAIPGLKLVANRNFDAIPDLDGLIQHLDGFGGVFTNDNGLGDIAAGYEFASAFDFGSIVKVRLTTILDTLCFNALDDFDARPGNMDTWQDFDGLEAAPCSVSVAVSYSKDGIDYHSAEFTTTVELECQYVNDILLFIRNTDPQYNMYITKLGLQAATATM